MCVTMTTAATACPVARPLLRPMAPRPLHALIAAACLAGAPLLTVPLGLAQNAGADASSPSPDPLPAPAAPAFGGPPVFVPALCCAPNPLVPGAVQRCAGGRLFRDGGRGTGSRP